MGGLLGRLPIFSRKLAQNLRQLRCLRRIKIVSLPTHLYNAISGRWRPEHDSYAIAPLLRGDLSRVEFRGHGDSAKSEAEPVLVGFDLTVSLDQDRGNGTGRHPRRDPEHVYS